MRVEAGWIRLLSAVGAAALLASCGGGDGTDTAGAAGPFAAAAAAPELRGVVVDGAGEGTQVFLDLNGNQSRDDDEPQALAAADGSFALPVPSLSVGQLASAMLVAQASGAKMLMAPAASYIQPDGAGASAEAVISPLTTLVAAEVAFNGMTPEEARQSVDAQKQLGGKDPMANYAATRDSQLGSIARAAPGADQLAPAPRGRKAPAPEGYTRMIVKLDDSVTEPMDVAGTLAAAYGAQVSHAYRRAVKGFAIEVPDNSVGAFVDALTADARVDSVEEDQVASGGAIQSNATWGLDRVDQRVLPLTGSYSYAGNGSGVRAYIIDSGLRSTHSEFTGRVQSGFTAVGSSTNDCHGHGTHVAGTVGGSTWGMAKGVTIVPVRVLDCDNRGTISGIIAGIDWVVANARLPAVANLSITADSLSSSLDAAVERAVAAGITMAVAAGNAGTNSCNVSPARTPGALTVGATNSSDLKPSWSNYGTCLDVFAPGQDIKSAYYTSDTATYTMWGTSMATPHVAGLAAIMLQQNPALTPAQVATNIKAAATLNAIGSIGSGSPNVMLYANAGATDPVVTPSPPTTTTTAVSVASLTGSTFVDGRRYWTARVIVAVKDANGALVPGVVAKGNFTAGGSGKSCTTASNGTCTITSSRIGSTTASTTFTICTLTKTGATYAASSNVKSSLMLGRPDGTADTAKR